MYSPRETHCHAAVQSHGGFYCPLSDLANSASPVVDVKSPYTHLSVFGQTLRLERDRKQSQPSANANFGEVRGAKHVSARNQSRVSPLYLGIWRDSPRHPRKVSRPKLSSWIESDLLKGSVLKKNRVARYFDGFSTVLARYSYGTLLYCTAAFFLAFHMRIAVRLARLPEILRRAKVQDLLK